MSLNKSKKSEDFLRFSEYSLIIFRALIEAFWIWAFKGFRDFWTFIKCFRNFEAFPLAILKLFKPWSMFLDFHIFFKIWTFCYKLQMSSIFWNLKYSMRIFSSFFQQTTRSPNPFEISPRPFAVTTSPIQNRGSFGTFGQRSNGFSFGFNTQSDQRHNPYLDTTGFGEVKKNSLIALFSSCNWHSFSCQSTAQCTNNFLGYSLKVTKADWSLFLCYLNHEGKNKKIRPSEKLNCFLMMLNFTDWLTFVAQSMCH